MQVVLVVHGQKQKNGHGCKKGLWHKREKNIFFSLIDEMLQRSDLW